MPHAMSATTWACRHHGMIATIALEVSSTSEPMREACADVFGEWIARAQKWTFGRPWH